MSDYIYIIAPATAWVVAQAIKVALVLRKDGIQAIDAIVPGGMPSAHSAVAVSLATVIAIEQGLDSAIFGLALIFAAVVVYDAVGVRRASGENTLAIRQLQDTTKQRNKLRIHLAKGHTPAEAAAGTLLGMAIGLILTNLL